MTTSDLTALAQLIASREDTVAMLPVIEKELLHYEMLEALDRNRLLDGLTFQGGTCLRLCYGAVRYSEDLDFAGGSHFDFDGISQIKEVLEGALGKKYQVECTVSEYPEKTDDAGIAIKKWQVKVVTAPDRPDIPLQRISLEVASVPAHTRAIKPLNVNYAELPISYENVLLQTETLEEICADKLKAFLTANHIRYRDLWDMRWIIHRPKFEKKMLPELFSMKLQDYDQEEVARRNSGRIAEIGKLIESKDFMDQMRRFLPASVLEQTLAREIFRESMATELGELYERVMR